ncbi:hypothetical protein IGI04_013269 [Brassica rapa subsp. trilocularis]|uniref:Uncharacterized protein n=1 Tax=Brassica rapa subsp. trilocularis TaxID=1813537 RepID=A0ABQ7N8E4_BRACM|nr:hypothetical protein IGI04_025790 [Brassica rapa subsp. trilocularis]KAG5407150.1 hypothetical protein IGI04_013269 [Brassica rapa subsp. trilocularis]
MLLLGNQPSTPSDSVDLSTSLLLGFSVIGTRKTSRSMVNSWESLYLSSMRRYCIDKHLILDLNFFYFLKGRCSKIFNSADGKITALKELQVREQNKLPSFCFGHIWRTGFECHELKSVVFEDVPEALEKWHSSGIKFTYIQVVVD